MEEVSVRLHRVRGARACTRNTPARAHACTNTNKHTPTHTRAHTREHHPPFFSASLFLSVLVWWPRPRRRTFAKRTESPSHSMTELGSRAARMARRGGGAVLQQCCEGLLRMLGIGMQEQRSTYKVGEIVQAEIIPISILPRTPRGALRMVTFSGSSGRRLQAPLQAGLTPEGTRARHRHRRALGRWTHQQSSLQLVRAAARAQYVGALGLSILVTDLRACG